MTLCTRLGGDGYRVLFRGLRYVQQSSVSAITKDRGRVLDLSRVVSRAVDPLITRIQAADGERLERSRTVLRATQLEEGVDDESDMRRTSMGSANCPDGERLMEGAIGGYTGIEAEFYDLLRGDAGQEELNFYGELLQRQGGICLELGAGTGRLLLPLLAKGLNVHGLESSADMLQVCRQKASAVGVSPTLYLDRMETFRIPQKFDSILIEGGTFMLIVDRREAVASLENIFNHLTTHGQAIIELFLPIEDMVCKESTWKFHKSAFREQDDSLVFCSSHSRSDVVEQLKTGVTKYEVFKEGTLTCSQVVQSQLRWYSKCEFTMMLEQAGFQHIRVINRKIRSGVDEETTMIFEARRV